MFLGNGLCPPPNMDPEQPQSIGNGPVQTDSSKSPAQSPSSKVTAVKTEADSPQRPLVVNGSGMHADSLPKPPTTDDSRQASDGKLPVRSTSEPSPESIGMNTPSSSMTSDSQEASVAIKTDSRVKIDADDIESSPTINQPKNLIVKRQRAQPHQIPKFGGISNDDVFAPSDRVLTKNGTVVAETLNVKPAIPIAPAHHIQSQAAPAQAPPSGPARQSWRPMHKPSSSQGTAQQPQQYHCEIPHGANYMNSINASPANAGNRPHHRHDYYKDQYCANNKGSDFREYFPCDCGICMDRNRSVYIKVRHSAGDFSGFDVPAKLRAGLNKLFGDVEQVYPASKQAPVLSFVAR